jgi:obg-like ATPase 1
LAQISITDIAGLVKGASTGEGLGNAFLSHISAVDGIYHVVRAFPNEEVMHNDGEVDPIRDIETINGELIAKDLQALEKIVPDVEKAMARLKDKKKEEAELAVLAKVKELLLKGEMVKDQSWVPREIEVLNKHLFLTAKP